VFSAEVHCVVMVLGFDGEVFCVGGCSVFFLKQKTAYEIGQ